MNFDWPNEAIETLRKMAAEKHSCGDAARALSETYGVDISRCSAMGKANRLGIAFDSRSPNNHKAGRDYKTKARKEAVVSVAPIGAEAAPVAIAVAPEPIPEIVENEPESAPEPEVSIPVTDRVTLADLRNDTCRWPINDGDPFLFCGASGASLAAGRPYCAAHSAAAKSRTFTPEERREYMAAKKREAMEALRHA